MDHNEMRQNDFENVIAWPTATGKYWKRAVP